MEPRAEPGVAGVVDVLVGAGVGLWELGWWAGHPLRAAATAVVQGAVVVGDQVRPPVAAALGDRGRRARAELERRVDALLRSVTRRAVELVVTTVDLTELVRRHVDLDALVSDVDLDAAVARVDLDAAVARVDLDAAVARVDLDAAVARVDLDAAAARVDLDAAVARVDLDAILDRLDLDGIVAGVDVDAIVARVDVDGVVRTVDLDAIVDRIDLDELAARIDLAAIVARIDPNPLVAVVDVDAVLARIDIVGIAQHVVEEIDLPEIVRESTGTLSSDAVRAVRAQGLAADDVVAGVVDRLLRRRPARAPVTP